MQVLQHDKRPRGPGDQAQQLQHCLGAHRRRIRRPVISAPDTHGHECFEHRQPPCQPWVIAHVARAEGLQQGLGQWPIGNGGSGGNCSARDHQCVATLRVQPGFVREP